MMKLNYILIIIIIFSSCVSKPEANSKLKSSEVKQKKVKQINWLNIEAIENAVEQQPKDILIMVYATWCEESKRYHKTTYKDPKIVDYVNKHYHTALINAEEKDTINFRGKKYAIHPNTGHNEIVYELKARSIPSLVFLDKDFNIQGHKNGFTDVSLLDELLFQYKNNYK